MSEPTQPLGRCCALWKAPPPSRLAGLPWHLLGTGQPSLETGAGCRVGIGSSFSASPSRRLWLEALKGARDAGGREVRCCGNRVNGAGEEGGSSCCCCQADALPGFGRCRCAPCWRCSAPQPSRGLQSSVSVCPLPTGKFNPLCTVVCNEGFSHLGYLESALNLKRKRLVLIPPQKIAACGKCYVINK